MESFNARVERRLVRLFLVSVGSLVVLGVGGYFGVHAFRAWQERRLLAEAHALVNEGNNNRASFDAQRVLEMNPKSAGANRVLAEVSERNGLRTALDFRKRAAQLNQNEPGDELALARCAIRFGDVATASEALETISPAERETATYHALYGDVALLRHDLHSYESEISRAAELEPMNKTYALALAALRLNSADATVHNRGIRELEELQSDESLRTAVTRRLAGDALRHGDKERAMTYARQLNDSSHADFPDRLLLLSAMHLTGDVNISQMLAELQKETGDDAEKIGTLLSWMNAHEMSREAVAWIQTLPPALLGKKLLPLNVSDAFLAAADWKGLEKFLRGSNWGPAE
jgi:cytochrome c-type biogenesis protein CcmH/NrfG